MNGNNPWDTLSKNFIHISDDETHYGALENILFLWPPILDYLGNIEGKKVLDFGCGTGTFCEKLHKKKASVTGLDTSADMIRIAKNVTNNINYKDNIEDFKTKEFHSITSIHTFEFIEDINDIFSQLTNLILPQGKFCFAVHDPAYLKNHAKNDSIYTIQNNGKDYYFESTLIPIFPRSVKFYTELLIRHGFNKISVQYPYYSSDFKHQHNIPKDIKNRAMIFLAVKS